MIESVISSILFLYLLMLLLLWPRPERTHPLHHQHRHHTPPSRVINIVHRRVQVDVEDLSKLSPASSVSSGLMGEESCNNMQAQTPWMARQRRRRPRYILELLPTEETGTGSAHSMPTTGPTSINKSKIPILVNAELASRRDRRRESSLQGSKIPVRISRSQQ